MYVCVRVLSPPRRPTDWRTEANVLAADIVRSVLINSRICANNGSSAADSWDSTPSKEFVELINKRRGMRCQGGFGTLS